MKLIYKSRLDETFRKSASKVLSKYQRTATMILTSVALLFAAGNYGYAQYCASSAIFTGDEVISNVTLSSINNSSICGATAPGAGSAANLYSNFTGITAPNLTVGNSYPMSVTVATCGGWYGTYTNVYIDWNGDQDFLDANETVYTGAYTAAAATMTFNVVVPAGATPGVTRMRVVHVESSAPASCGTYYYGETEDYNVNVVASSACSGTPTGGATVTSNASPCPSTSYSLSLSGASTASGITYQWQSSPNGVTYTNIAGATSSFYNTTASTSAYYQCVLTCTASSSSATSTPVQVTVSSFINCYCTSNATSTADEEILNVSLATMSNTSSCGSTGGAGSVNSQYSNFTNAAPAVAIPNLTQGFSYPLSVQVGTCGGNYGNMTKVWIDYNQNGLFTDPGEQVYVSPTFTTGPHTESATILIPATALVGNTRMRVVTVETTVATSVNPCGTYTWGETEDYFVNIAVPLAIDAGISAWVSPTMPTCSFTDSMMVTLTNYGSDTLTNCTINWSHNGVTSTSPYFWTGSLPQFGTTTVNIGYVAYGGGDSFSAWTSLPNLTVESPSGAYNDQSDLNNLIAGLSGTYTIGGSAPDFPDMASAISVLNLSGVCGPTIFDIRSDTYFEQFELSSVIGMSATNTVTFRAETGNRDDVVFDFSPSTLANNYVARLNGADYYILEHMTLRNSAASYGRVVDVKAGSDYNTFSDLVLNTVSSSSTSNYMAVIYSGDGSNDKFNTFDGCQILGGGYGAYWFGSGSASLEQGTTFTNNDFENNYYMGLYSYYQNGATYNHNHLFGTSTYTSRYGMYLGYNQNGVQVNYNTIEGSATSYFYIGMYIYYSDATPTSNGLISNNSIAVGNASTTTNTMYGLYHYYSGFNNVYNNSINVNGGSASSMAAYLYSGGANNVKNNNFVTSGLGYAMYLYGAYTLNSSNNNNFKTNGTSPFYYNANIATLAAWQAALGHDANSIMVDPGYYSVFDLHVCSDSLNGMGAVVALVTDDMDGQARNATTPDIGSDEFAPLTQAGFLGADMDLCTGDSIVLSAGAPADAILWSNNDTTTTTLISAPGTYNVSVIGACGVSFDTIVVNQSNLVYTGYLVADTTVFCTGGSVLLTSSMLADTYSWTGGSSNDSLVVTAGGTIICNIEDACGTGTQSIVITENSAPTALFTSTPNYLTGAFTNTSTSPATGTSYLWDFGDGTTSTDVNPSHIYAIAGTYTVTLTVTNDCGTSTISHPFNTNLGLDEIAGLGTISVYPNPSNGLFNVDFNLNNELNATIKVTNVLGETICAKALGTINGLNKSAIDISTAAPGVYYVTVLSNDKTVYNNMVVKN